MSKYRQSLPQLSDHLFVTDAGLETELVFKHGIELPEFASFVLLNKAEGRRVLRDYFSSFVDLAQRHGIGAVLETPTWRANRDWGQRIGYDAEALAGANRTAVNLLTSIRDEREQPGLPIVISGNLGPRGDGYVPGERMSCDEAQHYHGEQVQTFSSTDADMVSAFTLNYTEEAIGIVRAARECRMPINISFTVETDGRLPTGETLREAIEATDDATAGYASYFMINCAHPSHFAHVLDGDSAWCARIRGIRANASRRSHAELDECTELDEGNPKQLGDEYRDLARTLPNLSVVGGCCGTDHRHVSAICSAFCTVAA